jgi:hypothetical protein
MEMGKASIFDLDVDKATEETKTNSSKASPKGLRESLKLPLEKLNMKKYLPILKEELTTPETKRTYQYTEKR